jgi:para-aminobenzoate synthetase component 1
MRIERFCAPDGWGDTSAPAVLRSVAAAASAAGLAPPAALIGDWFGSRAVIAPSVTALPTEPGAVFDVRQDSSGDGAVGGGWFGYLSYPDPGADECEPRIPEAVGGWSDCVLRQDLDGRWWYESLTGAALPVWLNDLAPTAAGPHTVDWTAPDRAEHRRGVLACLEAIAAGEVYQACVCTRFTGRINGEPLDFFADAVARTAPTRAAYVAGGWGAVASLSPELFLSRRASSVSSSPIKGTLPVDADPAALLTSVKDVAENIMIVDLVRNDLGRVAATGSVTVPELLAVKPAPGVWHLVSTVTAQVDARVPMGALLDATFPPASVTGTPKGRARELLRIWEPARRGIYCGTVGLASPVAGCELNVAIRTVEFTADGSAVLGVGGGITADSDADLEWAECLHKAASIVGAACRGQALARSTAS